MKNLVLILVLLAGVSWATEGITFEISDAYSFDCDGDGNADSVSVQLILGVSVTPLTANDIDSVLCTYDDGTELVIPQSYLTVENQSQLSIDLYAQQSTNEITTLTLYTVEDAQTISVGDRVGPVLIRAEVLCDPSAFYDSLFMTLSEPVSIQGEVVINHVAKYGVLNEIIGIATTVSENEVVLLTDKGTFEFGDSLNLNGSSGLTDLNGNLPHNRSLRVMVDITQETFIDVSNRAFLPHTISLAGSTLSLTNSSTYRAEIFSANGSKRNEITGSETTVSLDRFGLAPGIYQIKVVQGAELFTGQFILR